MGEIHFENGLYVGDVWKDNPHGRGRVIFEDGRKYEGDFVNGKMHGKGIFTWADGDRYEGGFVDGYITGKGKRTYADGGMEEGFYVMASKMVKESVFMLMAPHTRVTSPTDGYMVRAKGCIPTERWRTACLSSLPLCPASPLLA